MTIPSWLKKVAQVAPMVLGVIPATAPIAGLVGLAITAAGQIGDHTTTGAERKQHALELIASVIGIVNAKAGKVIIDPTSALTAADTGIETDIAVAKTVDASHPTP